MRYKNVSGISKVFHGVEFPPGEIREVSEYINHPDLIFMDHDTNQSDKSKKAKTNTKEVTINGSDND